jgi:hypothetical protein
MLSKSFLEILFHFDNKSVERQRMQFISDAYANIGKAYKRFPVTCISDLYPEGCPRQVALTHLRIIALLGSWSNKKLHMLPSTSWYASMLSWCRLINSTNISAEVHAQPLSLFTTPFLLETKQMISNNKLARLRRFRHDGWYNLCPRLTRGMHVIFDNMCWVMTVPQTLHKHIPNCLIN